MSFLETEAMNERFHEAEASSSPIPPTTHSDHDSRIAAWLAAEGERRTTCGSAHTNSATHVKMIVHG